MIQEVCLAPADSVDIYCGPNRIHFWQLSNVQLALLKPQHFNLSPEEQRLVHENRSASLTSVQEPPLAVTRQLFATSKATSKAECEKIEEIKTTLLRHLWTFRHRNCSEPLDRIYALKSMALDVRDLIVPRYGESAGSVYAEVTRKIIYEHKKLDVLGMCVTLEDCEPGSPGRPSWAPDFHSAVAREQRPFTPLTMFLSGYDPYYTATSIKCETALFPTESPSELRLEGRHVGTVTALGFEGATTLQDMVIRSRGLSDRLSSCSSTQKAIRSETFWRTLITNRTSENQCARAGVEGHQFQAWWETLTATGSHPYVKFAEYNKAILLHWSRRSFFTTTSGHIGLGPAATRVGDLVVLLAGAQVPFILRCKGIKFQVVGETYVHELMDGTYWEELEAANAPRYDFVLV